MPPKRLFKYQAVTPYVIQNLRKAQVWTSRPRSFRDPFDCALSIMSQEVSEEDVAVVVDSVESRLPEFGEVPERILGPDGPERREARDRLVKTILRRCEESLSGIGYHSGVSCFAIDPSNQVLWSHYAAGHRGVCIEFDGSYEPFRSVHPVIYADSVPTVRLVDVARGHVPAISDRIAVGQVLTKGKCWAYESEWRLLSTIADAPLAYPIEALTDIYLGCLIGKREERKVRAAVGHRVRFHRAIRSGRSFDLVFEPA